MNKLLIVILLILTACEIPPYQIGNGYYDVVYIDGVYNDGYSQSLREPYSEIKFMEISKPFSLLGKIIPDNVEIYQDPNRECYLFSISNKRLLEIENDFYISNKGKDFIFLIEKDTVKVASKTEYKKIEFNIKPHQYDSSLCKPKPVNK